ncbi:uncharacterized protein LOC126624474 [Malus sylvestris]|uniref:uncharacterized protein LOC126624474 n=1 Tax=Malus sylvestris TaxID=3752 RepID=UPI0021ABB733|nr:uncharacterized protein LOC126624474 [Malus sylvestris]
METVLPAKYEEAREEEKLRSQKEDFSDMFAENEKRKRKQDKEGKNKKRDFQVLGSISVVITNLLPDGKPPTLLTLSFGAGVFPRNVI